MSIIRFGGLPTDAGVGGLLIAGVMIGSMVLFTWIAALPLTLAVVFLYRRVRVLAYVCGAVLGPATIFGALLGGLFGPIGIVAYALVFSAPAWIALGITAQIQRGRTYAQNRRLRRLLRTGDIPELVKMGWRVESEVGDHVIVVKSHRVNHILHFLVTLFTLGLWLIPWIFIAITGGERRKTARKPVAPPKRSPKQEA